MLLYAATQLECLCPIRSLKRPTVIAQKSSLSTSSCRCCRRAIWCCFRICRRLFWSDVSCPGEPSSRQRQRLTSWSWSVCSGKPATITRVSRQRSGLQRAELLGISDHEGGLLASVGLRSDSEDLARLTPVLVPVSAALLAAQVETAALQRQAREDVERLLQCAELLGALHDG